MTFRTRVDNEWRNLTTDELFKGKTVVVFSLPGAFTPTCSSSHLPRYNELAPEFFASGVDAMVCISVNDAFVMNQWAKALLGGLGYDYAEIPARAQERWAKKAA